MSRPHLRHVGVAAAPALVRGRIATRTIDLPGCRLVHATFEPGARWSIDAAPFAGTERCERPHDAVVLAGTLGVQVLDHAIELVPAGHAVHLPAGHDAWCVGTQSCVLLEIEPVDQP